MLRGETESKVGQKDESEQALNDSEEPEEAMHWQESVMQSEESGRL